MSVELVLFMGLQGAGKSSFYRQRFSQSHAHVSKDLMKNKKHKSQRQERLIRELLGQGKSVVVDNMNLARSERAPLIALAKEFGVPCTLYYFPLTVSESFEKNEGINRVKVPPVAINSAVKKLEEPDPEEGLDAIFRVRMIDHHNFIVN